MSYLEYCSFSLFLLIIAMFIVRGGTLMYTLAIIDDEILSIKCIENFLARYDKYSFNIISAKSGREALAKFSEETPDILLVDIKMPGMDGFELIEKVQKYYNPWVKAIMVSGYSDFEYCKKAFQVKAFDYVLKPVKATELYAALEKVIDELENENFQRVNMDRIKIEGIIKELLFDNNQMLEKEIKYEKIKSLMSNPIYFCSMLRVLENSKEEKPVDRLVELNKCVDLILQRFSHKKYEIIYFQVSDIEFVLIGNVIEQFDVNIILKNIQQYYNDMGLHICIGISPVFSDLSQLNEKYIEATIAARHHLVDPSGENRIIQYNDFMKAVEIDRISRSRYQAAISNIFDFVSLGDYKSTILLKDYIHSIHFKHYEELEYILSILLTTIQQFFNEYEIYEQPLTELGGIISCSTDIDEILQWLIRQIEKILVKINLSKSSSSNKSIQKVIEHINIHYSDDLSLDYISSMANMSPAYFCEVFKKVTGKTYLDYLTEIRVEKAKSLLRVPNAKISDVAIKVGYDDSNYFSRVFKKYTGMSPAQYRKGLL